MKTLTEIVSSQQRTHLVKDCVRLVETEVSHKKGIPGAAIKTGVKILQAINPKIVTDAVNMLLDEFIQAMEPFYQSYRTAQPRSANLKEHWLPQQAALANALISVTDKRIESAKNIVIKKTYKKLRPFGIQHVEAAVPGIVGVLSSYVD
ncbi:MAG: hypothetical protein VYA34_10935 [Myxococcota bacterium]|nr:hypothetical protein [Myxococcota bacterium]